MVGLRSLRCAPFLSGSRLSRLRLPRFAGLHLGRRACASGLCAHSRGSSQASPRDSRALGELVAGQSVGAAEYGGVFLSLRSHIASLLAQSSFLAFAGKVPRLRAMPNPSINRTANGGSRLFASVATVPPLSSGYLKR